MDLQNFEGRRQSMEAAQDRSSWNSSVEAYVLQTSTYLHADDDDYFITLQDYYLILCDIFVNARSEKRSFT